MGEDEIRSIWKEYFEDLDDLINSQEHVAVHMWALMGFGELTTSEESLMEELRLR